MRMRIVLLSAAAALLDPAARATARGPATAEVFAVARVKVAAEEWDKESRRLEAKASRAAEDVTLFEALLAKRKAEAESARQEVVIYQLTHDRAEPAATKGAGIEEFRPPDPPPSPPASMARVYRGRVVGPDGKPAAGATVTTFLASDKPPKVVKVDADGRYSLSLVADDGGGSIGLIVPRFDAPGLARRVFSLDSIQGEPRLIRLDRGVTVTGRVVGEGRLRAGVKVVLVDANRIYPGFLGDWSATTDDAQGRFRFEGIPKGREYDLFFTMSSLKGDGAMPPRHLVVGPDDSGLDLGDIEIGPAHRVAGRISFADGRKLPEGAVANIGVEGGWDGLQCPLDAEGRFEFKGLPTTTVTLGVVFKDRYAPRGCRLSAKNQAIDTQSPGRLSGRVDRDVTGLVLLYEPGPDWKADDAAIRDRDDPKDRPLAGAEATAEGPRPPAETR